MSVRCLLSLLLATMLSLSSQAQEYPTLTVDQIKKMSPEALLKIEQRIESTYRFRQLHSHHFNDYHSALITLRDSPGIEAIHLTQPLPISSDELRDPFVLRNFFKVIQRLPDQHSYHLQHCIFLVNHDNREIASEVIHFYINSGEAARPWIHQIMPHYDRLYTAYGDEPEKLASFGPVMIPYLLDLIQIRDSYFSAPIATKALLLMPYTTSQAIPILESIWIDDDRKYWDTEDRRNIQTLLARHLLDHPSAYQEFLQRHEQTKSNELKEKLGLLKTQIEILKPRSPETWMKVYRNTKHPHQLRFYALSQFAISETQHQSLWMEALNDHNVEFLYLVTQEISESTISAEKLIPTLKELLLNTNEKRHSTYFSLVNKYPPDQMLPLLPTVLQLCQHEKKAIRYTSLRTLQTFGPQARQAWPILRQMLKDNRHDRKLSQTILRTLFHLAPSQPWLEFEVKGFLISQMGKTHEMQRAIRELSYNKEKAAVVVPLLIPYLDRAIYREEVIKALTEIGPASMPAADKVLRVFIDLPVHRGNTVSYNLSVFTKKMGSPLVPVIIRLLEDEEVKELGKVRLLIILNNLGRGTDRDAALPILEKLAKQEVYSAFAVEAINSIIADKDFAEIRKKRRRIPSLPEQPNYEDFINQPRLISRHLHRFSRPYHSYALKALDEMPREKRLPFLLEHLHFDHGFHYHNPLPYLSKRVWYNKEIRPALIQIMRDPTAELKQRGRAIEILAEDARYSHQVMRAYLNQMKQSAYDPSENDTDRLEQFEFDRHIKPDFGLYSLVLIQELMNSKQESDRIFAASLISSLEYKAYPLIPALIDLAQQHNFERHWSLSALVAIGQPAIQPLLKLYPTLPMETQLKLIYLLGRFHGDGHEAIPFLIETSQDASASLRAESIHALSTSYKKLEQVWPVIQHGLNDPSVLVRRKAVSLATSYRDAKFIKLIPLALPVIADPDESKSIRNDLIRRLLNIDTGLMLPYPMIFEQLGPAARDNDDALNAEIQQLLNQLKARQLVQTP